MVELDPRRWQTKPYRHQVEGVKRLVTDPHFALFDEMGAGKSKQVVDAACALAVAGQLCTVIILTPANVRSVWLARDENPELDGQIHRHGWPSVGHRVIEFHAKRSGSFLKEIWRHDGLDRINLLTWIVTNYEFLRGQGMLQKLVRIAEDGPTLLVCDESSFLMNPNSKQWKAVRELRDWCGRCVLLNGTPTNNNPLDLWGQFEVMDSTVFGKRFKNFYHFRWHFAEMLPQTHRGVTHKKIIGWKNLDELRKLVAPHALRRLKRDCLDLPPKIYTIREVPLSQETWRMYVELRRDALTVLPDKNVQVEPNAGVRLLRLLQLTSGILGRAPQHVPLSESQGTLLYDLPDLLAETLEATVTDISNEKLEWLDKHVQAELEDGPIPAVMVAQQQAGGLGISLTAANRVVYLSNTYSLLTRTQSEDRVDRPGPISTALVIWCRWRRERERVAELLRGMKFAPVFELFGGQPTKARDAAKIQFQTVATVMGKRAAVYTDVLATGPAGQRTVDHTVVKALKTKQQLADWTSRAWRRELERHAEEGT